MGFHLAMRTADGGERPFPVDKSPMVIGRDSHCDLRVAIPSVAQKHCEIVIVRDKLRLTDLGSESGTFHNGNRVEQAMLETEDHLTIGPVTFIVRK